MKFLRTVSTGRLLAVISAIVVAIGGGAAIAVAATGGGPVPKREPLAAAVHHALAAPQVKGISADISFTNNLIDSSDFAGQLRDPILQGASGRLWLSNGGRLRLELQSENGDTQVVVDHHRFWISDAAQSTVYEGTLPAEKSASKSPTAHGVPAIAQIQSEITRLMRHVDLTGAEPTDVAGRPAYRVAISPKHDGGLLGSMALAWDAARGVPLQIAVYARGNSTPVLALKATSISYGTIPASDFDVAPPAGDKVIRLAAGGGSNPTAPMAAHGTRGHGKPSRATGVAAVAKRVPFTLDAPKTLVGLPRHAVSLMAFGRTPAAVVTYGENLGGMAVIEQAAKGGGGAAQAKVGLDGLSLPPVSINGAPGQELSTALGTVIRFTRGGVTYTVIGSVPATAAELAARGL